eukprot:5298057-Ditylum_brightwellii.AAC.1
MAPVSSKARICAQWPLSVINPAIVSVHMPPLLISLALRFVSVGGGLASKYSDEQLRLGVVTPLATVVIVAGRVV